MAGVSLRQKSDSVDYVKIMRQGGDIRNPTSCVYLVGAGRSVETPVAIIENGTTDLQRCLLTTLGELPGTVAHE
jgi:siroheme synthase